MLQSISGADDFQKAVLQSELPVLVDFWATWCGPFIAVAPVLEELAKEYAGKINFTKVNVDDNNLLAAKYSVSAIPTMLIFKDSQPAKQVTGYKSKKELQKALNEVLEE